MEWVSFAVAAGFGFGFGFIGSVPIAGPISALVFRAGVAGRTRRGQGIAIGSAIGEGIYAALAFIGVGAVFDRWPMLAPLSRLAAGIILLILGATFIRKPSPKQRADSPDDPVAAKGGRSAFFIGFGVTALNPTLIATWSAITATTYATGMVRYSLFGALAFGVAVTIGIALWFLILLELLHRHRTKFTEASLNRMVQGMGVFLVLVGGWFVVSGVRMLNESTAARPTIEQVSRR